MHPGIVSPPDSPPLTLPRHPLSPCRDYLRGLLPSFAKLPDDELKAALVGLVQPPRDDGPPPFTPAELIVALHQLEPKKDDLPLKAVMSAVDKCLHKDTAEAFPTEAVAAALQQLSEQAQLPLLFLRTVLQVAIGAPRLHPFLLQTLLPRLVGKQIWRNAKLWDGFLRCLKQLEPQSYPVAVLLPAPQLAEALGRFPGMRAGLRLYAGGPEARGRVPQSALALLMGGEQEAGGGGGGGGGGGDGGEGLQQQQEEEVGGFAPQPVADGDALQLN